MTDLILLYLVGVVLMITQLYYANKNPDLISTSIGTAILISLTSWIAIAFAIATVIANQLFKFYIVAEHTSYYKQLNNWFTGVNND